MACNVLLQIVQQLQTLGGLLKAPKQDLGLHNSISADRQQSKASGRRPVGVLRASQKVLVAAWAR